METEQPDPTEAAPDDDAEPTVPEEDEAGVDVKNDVIDEPTPEPATDEGNAPG